MHNRTLPRGFTLIELMIVISIIGILAGLTVAVVGPMQRRNQYTAAKATIQKLDMAINNYYSDCGAYPPTPEERHGNATIYGVLTGDINHDGTYNPAAGDIPRNHKLWRGPYLPIDRKYSDGGGNLLDPWSTPYRYLENERENPTCKANPTTYLLYSCGVDRTADDDPRENILNSRSPKNVDNVKNWEDE